MKDVGRGIVAFLLAIFILVSITAIGFGIKVLLFRPKAVMESVDMAEDVVNKTLDADKAIAEYEWFKRQAERLVALENKLQNAEQALEDYLVTLPEDKEKWTYQDRSEVQRLRTNVTGLENMLEDAIAEYNARSKMVNRAIFKDNLPSSVDRAIISSLKLTD